MNMIDWCGGEVEIKSDCAEKFKTKYLGTLVKKCYIFTKNPSVGIEKTYRDR